MRAYSIVGRRIKERVMVHQEQQKEVLIFYLLYL